MKYRVAHLGVGARGRIHANAFLELSDKFELVGLCDINEDALKEYAGEKGLDDDVLFTDAETMLAETRPDVFCFVTQPEVSRLMFTELAVKHGVKTIAFEKPMATTLAEAKGIVEACRKGGVRGVVSHQQKYLTSVQKMKEIVDSGAIGEIELITASCQAWLAQLGTHFVDYAMWANGFAEPSWVVGHVHGKEKLSQSHASPNYVMGQIGFVNGVRAMVEFGQLAAPHMGTDRYFLDNRLTVYGSRGRVWGETDGGWGGLINGEEVAEQGETFAVQEATRLQPLYLAELADWLDGTIDDHSCNLEHASCGYQVMEAICISAMDNVRVDLPLDLDNCYDMFERLRRELPECPELGR